MHEQYEQSKGHSRLFPYTLQQFPRVLTEEQHPELALGAVLGLATASGVEPPISLPATCPS